ncbi:MAG: S49 family peptidase [Gammaproteobacteria bacterium]|nr:S49 family peptidase [Gammaproteobacteria bacterium]
MSDLDDMKLDGLNDQPESWERKLVRELSVAALREQRRARRWGIFFKLLLAVYLALLLVLYLPTDLELMGLNGGSHTALVDLDGVISDASEASADSVISGLRKAFEDENTKGIVLRINSPGGSAVQSAYIHDEIKRLRAKHEDIPLYAVVTDLCASGGYYVAAAADKIYVNKASLVGSIGVLMGSFGFVDAMDKLGVERRLLTAGEHKALMDPFSPLEDTEVAHIEGLLERIHQQFIAAVRDGRGERLVENEKLFSGLIWTGEESLNLGLVDGLGSPGYVAREVIGEEEVVDFTRRPAYLERLADRFAVMLGRQFTDTLGTRGLLRGP